jgi:hypothetical protein
MRRWFPALLLVCGYAAADIDSSAYDAGGVIRSDAQRQALQRQFEIEREAEAAREAARLAELEQQRAAAAAREAARPWPERLTEQRCTLCHPATHYSAQRHTWLGWTLVVKRMVHLNKAPIPSEEHPVIVSFLLAEYPPAAADTLIEYGAPPLMLVILGGAGCFAQRWWRRRRTIQSP